MKLERVLRDAAAPLIGKLVPPLELEDLYQEGRIALWLKGEGLPDSHKVTIARGAMIDALRRARWASRGAYSDGAAWVMTSYDAWEETPDVLTDCRAASLIAVRQCIDKMQRLPQREREILGYLASGLDQREVAERIGLSPQRVGQLIAELRAIVARYV